MYEKDVIYLAKSRSGIKSGIIKMENGEQIPVDYVPSFNFDEEKTIDSNWTDISGYSADWEFDTENSEQLLQRVIVTGNCSKNLVMDFFAGSGTTMAVAQKLGKKWLGVEMGAHFYTRILPRMKEVIAGTGKHEPIGITNAVGWKGGGFFKYFELEQYEDALRSVKYGEGDLFDDPNKDAYNQYVFLRDLKMLEALDVDTKGKKVTVDLKQLYDGIDIAETLSNLTGKWIKHINAESVKFDDGEVMDTKNLDWKRIKPLIWW